MSEAKNLALLAADALVYFAVLAGLFRFRHRLGIGAFFCALGVMHFLESYLAAVFYVDVGNAIVTSPGSSVLFTGKLMLLLMVYIREDAAVVRQPIYGLLFGNLLVLAFAFLLRQHDALALVPGAPADIAFLDRIGLLMLWGTVILFVDAILLIVLYERSRALFGERIVLRLAVCGAAILSFDQLAFFAGLHLLTGAGAAVLAGGWAAKMAAVGFYAALVGIYLCCIEKSDGAPATRTRACDLFGVLTYRERYEDLLARSGYDALTGVFDRGRLERQGRRAVEAAVRLGRPASLLLVDIDHFKSYNDRFGHAAGDKVIKRIAASIVACVRATDPVFRFGGEEFVVICDGLGGAAALALGERIRSDIAAQNGVGAQRVTVSIGIATAPDDAQAYDGLFAVADARLYAAKAAGRNRAIGATFPALQPPVRLAG